MTPIPLGAPQDPTRRTSGSSRQQTNRFPLCASKAVGVRHLAIHSGFGCTVGPSAQPIRGRSLGRDPSAQTCARRAIRSGLLIGDASDSTADNCCRADQGVQIQCSISTAASTAGCTPRNHRYLQGEVVRLWRPLRLYGGSLCSVDRGHLRLQQRLRLGDGSVRALPFLAAGGDGDELVFDL